MRSTGCQGVGGDADSFRGGTEHGRVPTGCQEIAEEFRAQEIDGQALLLLKEDHLMSTMNIKLGPALKIYARISMLKDS